MANFSVEKDAKTVNVNLKARHESRCKQESETVQWNRWGALEATVLDTSACTRNSFNITNAKNTTLGTHFCSENVLLLLGGVGSRNKLSRWRQEGKIY